MEHALPEEHSSQPWSRNATLCPFLDLSSLGLGYSEFYQGRQEDPVPAAPAGPPLQPEPSWRYGPWLLGGPAGSSLP